MTERPHCLMPRPDFDPVPAYGSQRQVFGRAKATSWINQPGCEWIGRPRCLTRPREFASLFIGCPDHMLGRPRARMTADALSDVLKTVRLTGATFFDVVAKAPWVAESPPRDIILKKILPGAEHLIAYHVLTEGRCFASIIGEEPIAVEAGEVIVFTKGDPHVMSSSPGMRAESPPVDK